MSEKNTISPFHLMEIILKKDDISAKDKIELIDELRKNNPNTSDRWAYRWTIWILGFGVILTIISMSYLAYHGCEIPESLVSIGSTIAGGIVGLLSPAQRSSDKSNK